MHWSRARVALVAAAALFALNAWICWGLFAAEFTTFQSNEAAFIAISRFFRDHWTDLRWFPWFDGGMPVENAYQPVLPALTAVLSAISSFTIPRAFHVVLALAYCMGPVTLFWFVLDWSESLVSGFLAGLFYSLISPAAMLFPSVGAESGGGAWAARRLFNLVWYGEGPHNLALTLLPVALLFLRRAIERRGTPGYRWSVAGAIVSCSAVVLTNAFGALTLALGALCVALALRPISRGLWIATGIGVAGWCWISPWLPPRLIATMRRNAWSARGEYEGTLRSYAALAAVLLVFALLWVALRRRAPYERFVSLFVVWMNAFPLAHFAAGITLVPQSHRYILEMEMSVCMLLALLCARAIRRGALWTVAFSLALVALTAHQTFRYRQFAHSLIKPVEVRQTVEYKAALWIDQHFPAQRTMVSGDAAWLFNVFSDNPQMSGGHEPSAPNFIQQIAVYQIYSGMNAGSRDAETSLLWLKAFGNQAVSVPGPGTRENYRPFTNPRKFDGILPVLWREDGDTIYGVPQRSPSLAHVIPEDAVVARRPVNGLDLEPLRPYVAALDDPMASGAEMSWEGQSRARIHARMKPGEVISVQVNYAPGWHARVGGSERPVREDGLGLIVADARCNGDCTVELTYGSTPEIWICRALSAMVSAGMIVLLKLIPWQSQ